MKVVNVRQENCTHYIGRASSYSETDTLGIFANLGNPFAIGSVHSTDSEYARKSVIDSFERWARSHPDVMARIKILPEDAVLGCWCKPKACHGDVIVKIWRELHGK